MRDLSSETMLCSPVGPNSFTKHTTRLTSSIYLGGEILLNSFLGTGRNPSKTPRPDVSTYSQVLLVRFLIFATPHHTHVSDKEDIFALSAFDIT